MPIPFLFAAGAAVAGATGVVKGAKSIKNNKDAKEMIEEAQIKYQNAESRLENQREITNEELEKLGKIKLNVWANDMHDFLNIFSVYKNVNFEHNLELDNSIKNNISDSEFLKNIQIASMNAVEITQAGIASLGSGALAGVASYGGAMMFAHASTGTAIATLSGAAAKNATLAWFGGGAIKAGGLGMAGGSMVLGGIVIGPVLAVAGFILEAKSEENLAKAKKAVAESKQAIEKMNIMIDFMSGVECLSKQYSSFINSFSANYVSVINELSKITEIAKYRQILVNRQNKIKYDKDKIDFNILTMREKKLLHLSWLMTQVYYSILSASLLMENNEINNNAINVLDSAETESISLLNSQKSIEMMHNDSFDFANEYIDFNVNINEDQKIDALHTLIYQKSKKNNGSKIWKYITYVARFFGFLYMVLFGMNVIVSVFSLKIFALIISAIFCYVNYVMTFDKSRGDDLKKDACASFVVVIISMIVGTFI